MYGVNPPTSGYPSRYSNPIPGGVDMLEGGATYNFPMVRNIGPIVPDYTNAMPCNLQQRMSSHHQLPGFNSVGMNSSLEETLANLPYEEVQLRKELSNHSGE